MATPALKFFLRFLHKLVVSREKEAIVNFFFEKLNSFSRYRRSKLRIAVKIRQIFLRKKYLVTYEGTIDSTLGAIVLRRCEIRTARLGLGMGDFTSLFRRSIESAHAARLLSFES